jgi:glyoxylase-like metal-dependent hydrolase (beta-lactamase superfamily II)
VNINSIELNLFDDGIMNMDAGGPFGLVPRKLFSSFLNPDPQNRVPMALTSLVVRSEGKLILIDTGLGSKLSAQESSTQGLERPQGGLIDQLTSKDIRPEDIDIVINTHLHIDHCGGNTLLRNERLEPAFPNATYLVQRMEWAEASHPNPKLLHGDTQITENVRCVVTPGHTRGHQSVLLQSGDWKGMFLGDLASMSIHMVRTSWATAYDIDPQQTIATKGIWQTWSLENNAWLFFQHDPKIQIAQLVTENGRLSIKQIE